MVTGAAGGIGRATVEALAVDWNIVAVDRRQAEDFPRGVDFRKVDVSAPEAVASLFEEISRTYGRLEALINNAAIQVNRSIAETSVEDWDAVMASNLRSTYLVSKHAYPLLKAGGGAVVNVGSVHALATSVNIAAYAASKGGILALTRAMALEFGRDGVRVNAVLPGAVDTAMLRAGLNRGHLEGETAEQKLAALGGRTVLGRVGQPWEIARAILFLADNEQSSFVTGHALVVDGGATAKLSSE